MPRYLENTAQTNLICENPSYRKHIIDTAIKPNSSQIFKEFVHRFYAYLPVDYMEPNKADFFASIAEESFEFCKSSNKDKVAFLKDDYTKYSGSVLQIVTKDKPFIVDSIKYLLKKNNINIKIFLHPVISIKRAKNGDIEKVEEGNNDESIIFAILDKVPYSVQESLISEAEKLLQKIAMIVDSKEAMGKKLNSIIKSNNHPKDDMKFLQWVSASNFIFCSSLDYNSKLELSNVKGDTSIYEADGPFLDEVIKKALATDDNELLLGKMNQTSALIAGKFIDYILVRDGDKGTIFFGFYATTLQTESIENIPILNNKIHYILQRSGFRAGGYNYRKLFSIAEAFPRDALFQINEEDLYCICLHILSAMMAKTLKLFLQYDSSGEFLNVLIFMPIERLTPEVHLAITKYLIAKFDTRVITEEITDVSSNFCYLYVTLETKNTMQEFALSDIEEELDNLSARWHFAFVKALSNIDKEASNIGENIFPKEYQYQYSAIHGAQDYGYLRNIDSLNPILFNLQKIKDHDYTIKIYSSNKLLLSDILPLIENLGFKALNEQMFAISMDDQTRWLCEFTLSTDIDAKFSFEIIKNNVEEALHHMSIGELENDILCNLIVVGGFKWRQVNILKAITAYIVQMGFTYGREYVQTIMVKHYSFSELLIKLFEAKFVPDSTKQPNIISITKSLETYLNTVTDSVEDKILRTIQGLIEAITRTNCYQTTSDGRHKPYLSFKLNSKKVPGLPLPLPYAEIFVYANDFEAIHLRGGKVARGGIRWSDRKEDYRTEALGLMKAQMTKNSVIVPVGSKGAFFIKLNSSDFNKTEYFAKVVECYKNFLRGMLDITDNIIDGKLVHPDNVVVYDEEDPYLVVAADKGTASFSDYANSVSAEYNFWLGDAFASGGSVGYDHKKMAITAKGGWISVTRHFAEMGINVQKDPITVIGIGDMSGDVFGNGMLLSETIKLVAAFNHSHIFIDPTPDPIKSFIERKRLFETPGSKWSDYNNALMSQGGGVYERAVKKITLSPEAKALLDVTFDEATPELLINTILKANVDLLWNGGIGTYVKASSQSHLDVGDKANDALRCNGNELRAKVVGEGGNLGFSQLGRIEYAKNGGRINTDFIDNSAGVDCSDHEVNIKIAFGSAVKSGKITMEERNKLLADMTQEVEKLVLKDNYQQTLALTIAQHSTAYNTGMFGHLMTALEAEGRLNRVVEFLPSSDEIAKISIAHEKLSRPKLAVLMSYSKMSVYNELLTSSITEDSATEELLINYFPPLMRERFKEEILSHPLKKEIILTVITNKIINELGSPMINHIKSETGAKLCDIVRAYMIISKIFDIENLWQKTEDLSGNVNLETQIDIFSEIIKLLRRGISWFIRNLTPPVNIADTIEFYGESVQKLCDRLNMFLLGEAKQKLNSRIEMYKHNGVPENFAHSISILDSGISTLDVLHVAHSSEIDILKISELYFKVADYFHIDWMRKCVEKNITESYWNRMSIQALKDDLYDKQRRVLQKVIDFEPGQANFEKWLEYNDKHVTIFINFIEELKLQENIDLNMMILANKQFEMLLRKV